MAIGKHMEWDGKKLRGYVDIGTEMDDDSTDVATEAIVFMVLPVDSHLPPRVFPHQRDEEKQRANDTKLCSTKLAEAEVRPVSLTCDGLSCNTAMSRTCGLR